MRRFIAVLLVSLLAVSMAACSQATPTAAPTSAPASTAAAATEAAATQVAPTATPDPMGKYAQPIVVTTVRSLPDGLKFAGSDSIDNNVWTREYESALGIQIKNLWTAPEADYPQKVNIAITSGDIPDIMQVNAAQLKMMMDNGQTADITSVYNDYAAPFTKQVMSSDGGNALKSATFGGKLYAIPLMSTGLGSADVLWVRNDWLKNLNLNPPKTMDDVIAIAKAFANNDPDKDGKQDTFGLGINKGLFGMYAALEGFFNGYGAYPNIWFKDSTGSLVYGSVQPEIKTALTALQQMYNSGLIDKEFGVKDFFKVSDDVNAGKIGMFYGYFWNVGWQQDAKNKNPAMEWTPYALPSATGSPAKAQVPFAITNYIAVSKKCANPEAAVKLLNIMLEKSYGATAEPSVYNVSPDGIAIFAYPVIYCEPPMKNFEASQKVIDALNSKDASSLNAEQKSYYDNCMKYLAGDMTCWGNYKMYGPGGSLSVIGGYSANGQTMDNQFFGAPTQAMTEKGSTLDKLELTTFTDIIMGASTDEFDKFVTDWGTLGGTQEATEANAWLKTQ